ncbi:hypothetical protein H0Z60_14345 [Ectothiorhodospiraceae bacterium WFHF3C12]|nr:hypothetical protein [Ectothiorhodospiraceae bacterium WFHF3C12]
MKIRNTLRRYGARITTATTLGLASMATYAQSGGGGGIDVSAATDAITTDGGTAIAAVGGALIGLAGIAVVYKWVKGAIFG